MKRRGFLKGIAAAPAAPTLLAQQTARGRGGAGAREVPKIEVVSADTVSEPVVRFFNPQQFAALQKRVLAMSDISERDGWFGEQSRSWLNDFS